MTHLNTSRAQEVEVDIYNYDNLPLSLTYTSNAVAINLTNYRFDFYLKHGDEALQTYTITSGATTSTYLSKTGASVNVLNMELMFEHIRDTHVEAGGRYKLIQVVTDGSSIPYVHIIYTIDANRY